MPKPLPVLGSDEDVARQVRGVFRKYTSERQFENDVKTAAAIIARHVSARTAEIEARNVKLAQAAQDVLDWCVDPSSWKDEVKDKMVTSLKAQLTQQAPMEASGEPEHE